LGNNHISGKRLLNSEYLNIYNNLTEKEKAVISAYGATNSSETLCESLVMYYREPNKLPISLKNFFDKLKEHGKR
jgi:Mlc titration factor MtfA (ptsG expression regulator)